VDFRPIAPATVWVPSCFVIAFVSMSWPFFGASSRRDIIVELTPSSCPSD